MIGDGTGERRCWVGGGYVLLSSTRRLAAFLTIELVTVPLMSEGSGMRA